VNLPIEEQSMAILRFSRAIESIYEDINIQEKAFKEIQKSVIDIANYEFVFFDEFIELSTLAMDKGAGVSLQKQGTRFMYQFPKYSELEKEYIQSVVTQTLFWAGIIQKGIFEDKECISITEFGKSVFGAI